MSKAKSKLLRLYVVGNTPAASLAIETTRYLHEKKLGAVWALEIVDVLRQTELAEADKISAVPALVRIFPRPSRRVVGDLTNHDRVIQALEIQLEPVSVTETGVGV